MIKNILVFFIVFLILFAPVVTIHAVVFNTIVPDCNRELVDGNFNKKCGWEEVVELANNILKFLVAFSVIVATLIFTYAGFLYLTAGGKEDQIKKAHNIFKNVGIGFVFVLAAFLIVSLILDTFGVTR